MIRNNIILIFVLSLANCYTQLNDTVYHKFSHSIEQTNFYRLIDKYSGSEFLYSFLCNRKENRQIGLSSGFFFHSKPSKNTTSSMSRLDYLHIPIYLTFQRKNKKATHFFESKFGYILKTFYDTQTIVYTPEKIFWASANDLEEQIQYVFRRNHWLVISFDHKIKIYNHLALMYGLNFHLFANKSPAVINKAWSDREVNLGIFSFAHLGLNYSF